MDVHPDASLPAALHGVPLALRVDDLPPAKPAGREETAAVLRARLLRMIVANEQSRQAPPPAPAPSR